MDKPEKPQSSRSLPTINTPFCGDLRSKKFYIHDEIFMNAEDFRDQSGHIFCYHTQMPVGPDGFRVEPESCTPDRCCYRSALSEPTGMPIIPTMPKIEKQGSQGATMV